MTAAGPGRPLVYGATGSTGGLVAREAAARGLPVVLGRPGSTRTDLEG